MIGILNAFDDQYKHLNKITTVKVTSATALDAASLDAIKAQLIAAGKTEASVELHTKVDPSILGGFILEFDGKVYDASVAYKLNRNQEGRSPTSSAKARTTQQQQQQLSIF